MYKPVVALLEPGGLVVIYLCVFSFSCKPSTVTNVFQQALSHLILTGAILVGKITNPVECVRKVKLGVMVKNLPEG